MAISLFNSIASWFLKKRIHQIELFVKYPHEVQLEVLQDLLRFSEKTEVGLNYEFSSIKTYQEFFNRVPIVSYEDISDDIKRSRNGETNIYWPTPIKWFAKSSGTTDNKSKFIPVSSEALDQCHYKAGKDVLSFYFNNNPDSVLLNGKNLRLGGSQEIYDNSTSCFGDLSAIIIENMPFWAEISSTPSHKVSMIPEWEKKLEAILKESVNEDVTSFAGVPSWMMVLLNKILEQTQKKNILEVWPNLEVFFHGGVSFKPYKNQYKNFFPGSQLKYYETYNASEGFFGIQDLNNSDEMLLMLDYGIFFEFIPVGGTDEDIILLTDVQLYKHYALVISTNSGLWRYKIGDVIKFTSVAPYRIHVVGRTKHFINAFGEELVIENADLALSKAAQAVGVHVIDYTVAPVFMDGKKQGTHQWLIEFDSVPEDLTRFTLLLDEGLRELNSDYDSKRYKNMIMRIPELVIGQQKLFYKWLSKNNKLGGQNKIPRLCNNRDLMEELLRFNAMKQL
tara:strand:- start:3507 stop:5024 length:1518 start_codon:yes stop_codon:yes gene_type:complete